MLDIKFIKENLDLMRKTIKDKRSSLDLDKLLGLYDKRSELLTKVENLRAEKNKASKEIVNLKGDEKQNFLAKLKELDTEADKLEAEFKIVDEEYQKLMWWVPLPPKPDAIVGGEEANKVLYQKGKVPQFDFTPKDHMQLGADLGLIEFEAGVKLMGSRGYFLKDEAAVLQFALIFYGLEFLRKRGFHQLDVPVLADERFFYGTGHLPFGGDEIFKATDKHKEFGLIGTAEIALLGYFADNVLKEEDLPIKVMAFSPCFRTEVGSYGRDTKGLYRLRQFYKVEQVIIAKNDTQESMKLFGEILKNSEDFLTSLDFPYQVLELATGDMGAGKYHMYDIETYMPSRSKYSETHSCSFLGDWQARRSNIRYTTKDGKKLYAHTLNNTLVATPRILIPLLELNQQKDGSIKVPQVLQKYTGFSEIRK